MGRHRHRRRLTRESARARRRQRRVPRREERTPASYVPVQLAPDAAARGVQARLSGAMFAGMITAACMFSLLVLAPARYTALALIITAIGSFTGSVALILSARREELVHQLASDLLREDRLLEPPTPGDPTG